jgi:3',5'-nucleoside bisphosphate phosphatase
MIEKDMTECVDLHLHSCYSDGLHPPSELVRMAAERGVRAIAIADHDSVDGIDEAIIAGESLGVEIVPAVELSVSWRGYRDVHLLGYLIDHHDPHFAAMLKDFRINREERGRAILERINARLSWEKKGSITYEEVLEAAGGAVGRPHIARVMIARGFSRSIEDAFTRYLEPCNVPKFHITFADAVEEVKRIGGVAVLAHPSSISDNRITLKNILIALSEMGLEGIEVYSNMCYKEDINYFNNIARQLGLLVTGGSDYHGFDENDEIGIVRGGLRVPYDLLHMLKESVVKRERMLKRVRAV